MLYCFFIDLPDIKLSATSEEVAALDAPIPSGVPVFLHEPDEVYYVLRGRPVTVRCRAAPAVQINVKCAGQWVQPDQLVIVEGTDPITSVRYLQTSVELKVGSEELEGYWCECHAWNSQSSPPQLARSRRGQLVLACKYLTILIN